MAARETERRRGENRAAFAVGILLGGTTGAVWTLFNVPRSGAETRAALARAVESAVRGAQDAAAGVRERIRATGERAADRVALAVDAITGGTAGNGEPERTIDHAASPATASSPSMAAGTGPAVVEPAALTTPDGATGATPSDDPPFVEAAFDPPGAEAIGRPATGSTTVTI